MWHFKCSSYKKKRLLKNVYEWEPWPISFQVTWTSTIVIFIPSIPLSLTFPSRRPPSHSGLVGGRCHLCFQVIIIYWQVIWQIMFVSPLDSSPWQSSCCPPPPFATDGAAALEVQGSLDLRPHLFGRAAGRLCLCYLCGCMGNMVTSGMEMQCQDLSNMYLVIWANWAQLCSVTSESLRRDQAPVSLFLAQV